MGETACRAVLFRGEGFDDAAWVADSDRVGGDIAGYNGACSDGAVVADGYSREDSYRAANPAVVADRDGFCPFLTAVALCGVGAVASGIDRHIRSDKSIITNGNIRFVKHRKMEIGKETLSDTDMGAIIAIERLVDKDLVIASTEHFAKQCFAFLQLRGAEVVVLKNHVFAAVEFHQHFGGAGIIDLSCEHFFFFCHNNKEIFPPASIQKICHWGKRG